jgi:hypothetical protein
MRQVNIADTTLRQWYVDDRLTIEHIADRLQCGTTTVWRKLRSADIAVRRRGPQAGKGSNRRRIPALAEPWLPELAWAVGLIATDGNLSRDGRRLAVVPADYDLLEPLKHCLVLDNRITDNHNCGRRYYRLQWSDKLLYDALVRIGLHPAKSLTLGPLVIPDARFADFFRGCIDGDGSIVTYTDRYHVAKDLAMSISDFHRRPLFRLRYARRGSLSVLRRMYYSPAVICSRGSAESQIRLFRRASTIFLRTGAWRNGRLGGLKSRCPQGRRGSNPLAPTNSYP